MRTTCAPRRNPDHPRHARCGVTDVTLFSGGGVQTPELQTGLRPEDTLPTVNPRGGRKPATPVGDIFGITHRGNVRKANEDHFLVAELERTVRLRHTSLPTPRGGSEVSDALGTLMMVADGMGGHGNGDLASAVTLDTVLEYATYAMPWARALENGDQKNVLNGFAEAARHCQERLRNVAARKGASEKMGTTLTLAYVVFPDAYVAHVGDSRCYVWRKGALTQVTRDHTLAAQLRARMGERTRGSDLSHFDHVLVNAVGGDGKQPEVEGHRVRLAPQDRLILCSDGLFNELDDSAIAKVVAEARSAAEACHSLASAAIAAGGRDNVTVIAAFF
jgi:PPM family protein phosphatase